MIVAQNDGFVVVGVVVATAGAVGAAVGAVGAAVGTAGITGWPGTGGMTGEPGTGGAGTRGTVGPAMRIGLAVQTLAQVA